MVLGSHQFRCPSWRMSAGTRSTASAASPLSVRWDCRSPDLETRIRAVEHLETIVVQGARPGFGLCLVVAGEIETGA